MAYNPEYNLFGYDAPIIEEASLGAFTLEHSRYIQQDWIDPDVLEDRAPITGNRNFDALGHYSNFIIEVDLFEYADPVTTLANLYEYLFTYVTLKPYTYKNDGSAMTAFSVPFFVIDFDFNNVFDPSDKRNQVRIVLQARAHTDLADVL